MTQGSDTYYWRVLRVNGATVETPVSNVYRTLFIGALPGAPTLLSPAQAALVNDSTPAFSWEAVVPPAGVTVADYELQVANNATFTVGLQVFVTASPTYTPVTGLSEGLHYWRVRARFDVSSPGGWSLTRSFVVDTVAPASAPNLINPVNAVVITATRTPTFTWSSVPTASRYLVELATDSGFTAIVIANTVAGTTFTVPSTNALVNGQYYWRVKAQDAAGNFGPASAVRHFTIAVPSAIRRAGED